MCINSLVVTWHVSSISYVLKDLRNLLSLLGYDAHCNILYFYSSYSYNGLFTALLEDRSSTDQPNWSRDTLVVGFITYVIGVRVYNELSTRSK